MKPTTLDPALKRLLRWAAVRWAVRLGAVTLTLVLTVQLALTWRHVDRVPVSAPIPDRARLDSAIAGAEAYLDRLYQELPDGMAVVSEYSGLPLRARFLSIKTTVVPGDEGLVITSGEQSRERETFLFDYDLGETHLELLAVLRWDEAAHTGRLEITQVDGDLVPVKFELGDLTVARWLPGSQRRLSVALTPADLGQLRSLRYTVRHVAMLATSTYKYRGEVDRSERLRRLVEAGGYNLTNDVYSPVWGKSFGRPDDYLYDDSVYPDCADGNVAALPSSSRYYAYGSKVCSLPTFAYIALTREDPLAHTLQAIHVLQEKDSVHTRFTDGEHEGLTPKSIAADLEKRFREEVGIGVCLPTSCTTDNASTLRTALFGLLETQLGFGYGDNTAVGYADAAIDELLRIQVPPSGVIRSLRLGDLYRPAQAGGFFTSYDSAFRSGVPQTLSRQQIDLVKGQLDDQPEYLGEIATNAETTLVVYNVLVRYRCARYGVGCARLPDVAQLSRSGGLGISGRILAARERRE